MKRIRGKHSGEQLTLHDYCNDWIQATAPDGRSVIVSPLAVQLDPEEMDLFADRDPEHEGHGRRGTFWIEWNLRPDGRFARKEPRDGLSRGRRAGVAECG